MGLRAASRSLDHCHCLPCDGLGEGRPLRRIVDACIHLQLQTSSLTSRGRHTEARSGLSEGGTQLLRVSGH